MKCHLCLNSRKLCDSHIIPEFLFRPGYDEKHRQEVLKLEEPHSGYIQKGLREPLLCVECEHLLDRQYESYFSRLWYKKRPLPASTIRKQIEIKGLDYTRFKLFHLSILWRASVSSLSIFSPVSLEEHENQIRKMLLDQDPKTPFDYPILGAVLLSPGTNRILDGFMISPTVSSFHDIPVYMFVFGGCVWHYVAVNERYGRKLPIALSADGTMKLPVHDLRDVKPLDSFLREYVRLAKR